MENQTLAAIVDLFEDVQVTTRTRLIPSVERCMLGETAGEWFGHKARSILDGVVRVSPFTEGWINYSDSAMVGVEPVTLADKVAWMTQHTERLKTITVSATLGGAHMHRDYVLKAVEGETDAEIQGVALAWLGYSTYIGIQCWADKLDYCSDLPAVAKLFKDKGLLE